MVIHIHQGVLSAKMMTIHHKGALQDVAGGNVRRHPQKLPHTPKNILVGNFAVAKRFPDGRIVTQSRVEGHDQGDLVDGDVLHEIAFECDI